MNEHNAYRESFDVVVVGGGPAGSSAAIWLARAGYSVCLVDRARFPRDKACGEFLTPRTRELLTDLGAWELLCAAGLRTLNATVLYASDGTRMRYTPPDGGPVGYSLRRVLLDSTLLDVARQSGVQVIEGFVVRDLLRDAWDSVCGVSGTDVGGRPTTLRARLVIGADGSHSLVARRLELVRRLPRLQRVAVVSHWHNVQGETAARSEGDKRESLRAGSSKRENYERENSQIGNNQEGVIEMRANEAVVCGMGSQVNLDTDSSPGDSVNLTLVAPTQLSSQIAGRAGAWVDQTIQEQFPDLAQRLAGAYREPVVRTVGCFGHICQPAVSAGAMLVGDAATFIDPFTGEGVYFGLRGAQLAAEATTQALRANDMSLRGLLPYHDARYELKKRYLLCDIVQTVVRTPVLLNRMVRRLERFPQVADRLLSVLADLRDPSAVLHPALLWRLFAPCW